jgi:hypothetical protein
MEQECEQDKRGNAPVAAASPRRPKRRLRSLQDLDRRTAAAKRAVALRDSITADLGGEAALSAMQKALVNNAALLGAALDNIAVAYLAGEPVEMIRFATLANSQARLLRQLGLERKALDIQQHLSTYLASKRDQRDTSEDDGEDP